MWVSGLKPSHLYSQALKRIRKIISSLQTVRPCIRNRFPARAMRKVLENQDNLTIKQAEVCEILTEDLY